MASFLDTGFLGFFSIIFSFLLVYAIVFGLLTWRKPFGDNAKGVYGIISLAAGLLMVISRPARAYIEFITPWFLALAVGMFLLIFIFSLFAEVNWFTVLKDATVYTILLILTLIILAAGVFHVFGQQSLSYTVPDAASPTAADYGGEQPVMTEEGNYAVIGQEGQIPAGYQQDGYAYPPSQGEIEQGQSIAGTPLPPSGVQYADNGLPMAGRVGPTATGEFETNLVNTLVHPKVLGIIIVFLLGAVVVFFLSKPAGGIP